MMMVITSYNINTKLQCESEVSVQHTLQGEEEEDEEGEDEENREDEREEDEVEDNRSQKEVKSHFGERSHLGRK